MVRTIGMKSTPLDKIIHGGDRPPRLLLIGGATGVGKSTTAVSAANKLGFSRLLSTDAVREIIRSVNGDDAPSALNRSSFSRGEAGDPVVDWLETCLAVEAGVQATVSRARREGIDLCLEGVHLVPENRLLREWKEAGGVAVGVVLHIGNPETHQSMLEEREENSWRRADRYLAALPRLQAIQQGMLERAKITDWVAIDPSQVVDVVDRISHLFDLQWNQRK